MSAIDFPDSPSVDDLFTAGNRTWKWNGTVWEAISAGSVIPSDPYPDIFTLMGA
jgi:hypothetical protein